MQGIRNATQLLLASFDTSESVSNAAPAPGQTAKEIAKEIRRQESTNSLNTYSVATVSSAGIGATSVSARPVTHARDLEIALAAGSIQQNAAFRSSQLFTIYY